MIGQDFADALVREGFDLDHHADAGKAFTRVLEKVRSPSYVAWTPGRLEVFGTHTDYAGGRSIVCAVPKGIALAAAPRDDDRIVATDCATGESASVVAASGASPFDGWRRYVAVTAARLARNFPGPLCGCDIAFASTLPRASGMSSSSALVVAIASAVVEMNHLGAHPAWTANIHSSLDRAGYFACVENGRSFGTLTGDGGVGTHGGSEDHAAILAGRPSGVTAFRFAPMSRLDDVAMPEAWRFVVAPSAVRAEKTGGAQASYNRLAREVDRLVAIWNAHGGRAESLAQAVAGGHASIERLRELVRCGPVPDASRESMERRLDHFVREDGIVAQAVDAFRCLDTTALGALSSESQHASETLLDNQVPETVRLARDARRLGAFAARSFGAGFGGSVWALIDARDAAAFSAAWHARAFVMQPAPPHAQLL
jgi:galactokinase